MAKYHDPNLPPTAEEIEEYKQEWKREGFPDMEHGTRHGAGIGSLNEPITQPSAEYQLWAAFLHQLVEDYLGSCQDAQEACMDCRREGMPCKCMLRGDQVLHQPDCPETHTNQECAEITLFEDLWFEELYAGWLGSTEFTFDLEYLRKTLKERRRVKRYGETIKRKRAASVEQDGRDQDRGVVGGV